MAHAKSSFSEPWVLVRTYEVPSFRLRLSLENRSFFSKSQLSTPSRRITYSSPPPRAVAKMSSRRRSVTASIFRLAS